MRKTACLNDRTWVVIRYRNPRQACVLGCYLDWYYNLV
jgi:hypothetical protein